MTVIIGCQLYLRVEDRRDASLSSTLSILGAGWTGDNCEVDRDDCVKSRCRHGATCVDKLDDFECRCAKGYEGITPVSSIHSSVHRAVMAVISMYGPR